MDIDERRTRITARERLAAIDRVREDDVHVLVIDGELDISNVEELRQAALALPNDAAGLVVDLGRATFIDSSTVALLFELRSALQRRNQVLRVACPPGSVADRVLTISSFDEGAREDGAVEDAVAAIRAHVSPPG
jgi:anti-anti-sigma factor